jgi:hypothetical protein
MPTADRAPFVRLALETFAAQLNVDAELVVVDSGAESVASFCENVDRVRYVRAPPMATIGTKRNLACEHARGEFVVHWDDDDWCSPLRLERQIEPLESDRADVTALYNRYTLNLGDGSFWTLDPELHRKLFVGDVAGGTLAFRRSFFARGLRYPDVNLAEDAAMLVDLTRAGARLERVVNDGLFVYVRHGTNTWRFVTGAHIDARGWSRTSPPRGMSSQLVARYREAAVCTLAAREASIDCLGNTHIDFTGPPAEVDRCIALAVTESYASLLEGALASLERFGEVPKATRFVFVEGRSPRCESIAARFGANVVHCRLLAGYATSIKGALYSMTRVVRANQYLCLDADVLVLDSLASLFERHAALPRGMVLVAPEATEAPAPRLRAGLATVYRATPIEVRRLVGRHTRAAAEAPVVNDGVFVADRDVLESIAAILRREPFLRAWVNARRDVWWRPKAAFNLALARLGAIEILDGSYNAQLHAAPAARFVADARARAAWKGRPAHVLHFNGRGRGAYDTWRSELRV